VQQVLDQVDIDKDLLVLRLREKSPDLRDIWVEYGKSNQTFKIKTRLQHTLGEYRRVLALSKIIGSNDPESKKQVREIINASHASLRDLYEVSVPEVDSIQGAVRDCSWGCRVVGAGFGGSLICLVDASNMRVT